ncbi:MAG: methyl-accepting chemotaxis protein [Pseudomonadota bacterium]
MSIRQQIMRLTPIAAAGMLLVGAVFFFGEMIEGGYRDARETARAFDAGISALESELLGARQAETTYMLRRDPAEIEAHARAIDAVEQRISALRGRLGDMEAPGAGDRLDAIDRALAGYEAAFADLVAAGRDLEESGGPSAEGRETAREAVAQAYAPVKPEFEALHGIARETEAAAASALETAFAIRSTLEIALLAAAIAGVLLVNRAVARRISEPLAETAEVLQAVAAGSDDAELRYQDREDEVGAIATAFNDLQARLSREAKEREAAMREKAEADRARSEAEAESARQHAEMLQSSIRRVGEALERMAEGDLAVRLGRDVDGEFADLRDAFNSSAERIGGVVARIREASDSMAEVAGRISSSAEDLNERASSQAASLEETAATVEEISATIKTTADNSEEAHGAVVEAAGRAEKGGQVVREAVEAMSRIEESSQKISEINTVIDSIAFQTNLLALNAAVEAARAGEAGKGFAVVAAEVRTLAQRSSEAAKDITGLIQESSGHVTEGARLVRETGDALGEIESSISGVTGNVGDISSAGREQASAVAEISTAVSQMDEMTQQNADLAEQSANRGRELETETDSLRELVGFFRTHGEGEGRAAA